MQGISDYQAWLDALSPSLSVETKGLRLANLRVLRPYMVSLVKSKSAAVLFDP